MNLFRSHSRIAVLILVSSIFALIVFLSLHIRVVRLDEMVNASDGGFVPESDVSKQEYFDSTIIHKDSIYDFISNKTFVVSHEIGNNEHGPIFDNFVEYFDSNSNIFYWHSYSSTVVTPTDLQKGRWWLDYKLDIILYKDLYKLVLVTRFCKWFDAYRYARDIDNCVDLRGAPWAKVQNILIQQIFSSPFRNDSIEFRDGDVFGISRAAHAPFHIPMDVEATFGTLDLLQSKAVKAQ